MKESETRVNGISYMNLLRLFCIALILLISNKKAHATYTAMGCVSDHTGYLYTGPSGVNSPRPGGYGPAYETTPVITAAQIGTGIYCSPVTISNCVIRTKTQCTQCTGPYDYDPTKGKNEYYEQAGKLKKYVACPIDDYAGLILLVVGTVGFAAIRRNFTLM